MHQELNGFSVKEQQKEMLDLVLAVMLLAVMLDYMHALVPVNPLWLWRQFKSSAGMANSTTNNEKYHIEKKFLNET